MTIVVDASAAIGWFVEGQGIAALPPLARFRDDALIAPDLIVAEIGNALWKLRRAGILSRSDLAKLQSAIVGGIDRAVPCMELGERALALAVELDHPIYDCFYLALAGREETKVVTQDGRLLGRVRATRWERLVLF